MRNLVMDNVNLRISKKRDFYQTLQCQTNHHKSQTRIKISY